MTETLICSKRYIIPVTNPDGYEYTFTNDRMVIEKERQTDRQ